MKILSRAVLIFVWASVPLVAGCLSKEESTGFSGNEQTPSTNRPPTISGTPGTNVAIGENYSFSPTASDSDGDSLSFSIGGKPEWADFDNNSGALSGIPTLGDVGTYSGITITVSDGSASASLSAFTVTVQDDSAPPPPPPPPPPPTGSYVGFGSVTQGAGSCPTTAETYRVTSLSGGSGAGTLRDAVSQDCRHIIFDVAGEINLGDLQISNSYLTIDGSTAPEPGITLVNVGRLVLEASGSRAVHDVIVNNIRAIGQGGAVETNDLWELDGSSGAPIYNVVLDHLTMKNSGDGNVDIYGDVHDITLSNSLMMDSIQGQHYSQSIGLRERITVVGNVYARLNERQPRVRYNTRQLDFVGNVIYGWGWYEGGATGLNIDVGSGSPSANIENNVYHYVSGLNGTADNALVIGSFGGSWFFSDNTWPTGESQGDAASNSSRVSMVNNGVDYAVTRQVADVQAAGTRYPTAAEADLLQTISDAIAGGPGEPPPPPPPPPVGESQYRGIPDPSDALGFDVWADYPASRTINGLQGSQTISCPGTAANPCLVDASSATFTISNESTVVLTGPYAILQGGTINVTAVTNGPFISVCSNCVARDVELSGPKADSGHSTAVNMNSNSVWLRGSVHGFGLNSTSAREQDFHGFKPCGQTNIWILEAEVYDLSGDSVQAGDASRCSATNAYIGGGRFHHNRENGVDIKDSDNVVVSGVEMYGFTSTAENGNNPAIVMHDDARNSLIYDNIIHDTYTGIVSSGLSGHVINKNSITASQIGIELRNTQNINVTENTITAPIRIQRGSGVTGTVQD